MSVPEIGEGPSLEDFIKAYDSANGDGADLEVNTRSTRSLFKDEYWTDTWGTVQWKEYPSVGPGTRGKRKGRVDQEDHDFVVKRSKHWKSRQAAFKSRKRKK